MLFLCLKPFSDFQSSVGCQAASHGDHGKPCPAPAWPWLAPPSPSPRAFLLSHSASALCTLSFALFLEFILFSLSPSDCRVTCSTLSSSFTTNLCWSSREETLTTFLKFYSIYSICLFVCLLTHCNPLVTFFIVFISVVMLSCLWDWLRLTRLASPKVSWGQGLLSIFVSPMLEA